MRFQSHQGALLVMRDDLWAFAWSAPLRDLAKEVGLSDVGLKKLLRNHNVTTPPQGHWNKVHAGKPMRERPKAPDRRPGESGRVRLDERFAKLLPAAPAFPVDGPFVSAFVPEELELLMEIELTALAKVVVPANLQSPHPALHEVMKRQERQRAKYFETLSDWDKPQLDNPFDQRRLRFLNGLFRALAKRGHTASLYEYNEDLHPSANIGDTCITLTLEPVARPKKSRNPGYPSKREGLPAAAPMRLSFGRNPVQSWEDDKDGKLERRLAEIAASLIVAGEAEFRMRLREERDRQERQQLAEEKQRREALAALEQKRLEALRRSGELLREAENIRSLVIRVKEAVLAGSQRVAMDDLIAWETWALGYADRVDPVASGQYLTHLHAIAASES